MDNETCDIYPLKLFRGSNEFEYMQRLCKVYPLCMFSEDSTHSCMCAIAQREAVYIQTIDNDSDVIPSKLNNNHNIGKGIEIVLGLDS